MSSKSFRCDGGFIGLRIRFVLGTMDGLSSDCA